MSKILVIDDDLMVTKVLEDFLRDEGHEVTVSHTGSDGFTRAVEIVPDLILQDVMLPDATGFQMVDRFRAEPATQSVPIIMMSGAARHTSQQQLGSMMGADDYVLKPFNIDDMDRRIKGLLAGDRPVRPAPEPTPATPSYPIAGTPPSEESVSLTSPITQVLRDWLPEKPAVAAASTPTVLKRHTRSLKPVSFVFFGHLALLTYAMLQKELWLGNIYFALRQATIGWGALLGLYVTASAVFRITLEVRSALHLLGWAMTPILARSVLALFDIHIKLNLIPSQDRWIKSLDMFELASILIVALSLRWHPGGSFKKSLNIAIVLGFAWLLIGRMIVFN